MNIIKVANYEEMSKKAAEIIIGQIQTKEHSVLGLATGGTVIGTYHELVRDHHDNQTTYQRIVTFNLDEYVGMPKDDPHSYHHYMCEKLFNRIDLPLAQTNIPNGMAEDSNLECERYEQAIHDAGGIDLQLLGIGRNGHIGFNEPGTPFTTLTHVEQLTESTRQANARFFQSLEEVPTHAITMGIATIMKSKKILLLASGIQKAQILHDLITGEVTEHIPASILKQHHDVTIIADEEALSMTNF